jgi:PAP2 superfamily
MTAAARTFAIRRQPGLAELGVVILLYAAYELLRGLGDASEIVARSHAADIVALERYVNVFVEQAVQDWASGLPALPTLLGLFYVASHFGLTTVALVWMHRSHPAQFPLVRNTLVLATALSLVGYILYPAAPPRLSGHGFADTVSAHTHVNLSSDLLGSLYNPFAAVPSMHFGYSLIVGAVVVAYARRPIVRALGALYPPVMLFDIVATGNHFLFDAAMGALVVAAAWLVAHELDRRAAPVAAPQPA